MTISDKYNGIIFAVMLLLVIVAIVIIRSAKTNYYTIMIDAQIRAKNNKYFTGCYFR